MSKPAPKAPAKPNYLSTILFAVAAFLLFKQISGGNQNGPQTVDGKALSTSSAVLGEMRRVDALEPKGKTEAEANSDSANRLLPAYTKLVDDEKMAKPQADDLKVQASILAAHIQLKNGVVAKDTNKLRAAYNTIQPYERKIGATPVWSTTPVEVTERGAKVGLTGHGLHENLIATLSDLNKRDYIWGAIPGGYQFIDFLVGLTGHNPNYSYAFATLLLAFIVRAAVYPLSQKQLLMSRKMSQLTPRLKEIKEAYKDDQIEANKRSMELYSRYGINPFAGCLPALVQMPLFLTVYQCILHYQFEFTKGYFLWINPNTSAATHGFIAHDLGQQDYILIVIYAITMVISTLLTPVTDPTQAKQQRMIGLVAAVMFPVMMCLGLFPVVSGFVLYWTFTNLFSMAQSLRAYRMPMPELVEVNAPGGGVYPGKPKGKWAQMMEDMQRQAEEQQRNGKNGPGPSGGAPVKKPRVPKSPPGSDKISPSRPVGQTDGGTGGTGTPAKHKPKKRS